MSIRASAIFEKSVAMSECNVQLQAAGRALKRICFILALLCGGFIGHLLVASPAYAIEDDVLGPDEQLLADQKITSADGRFSLVMQFDGNLVLYQNNVRPMWESATMHSGAVRVVMQFDGNLVLYRADNTPVWASNTVGGSSILHVQNDGNLVIYRDGGGAVWATGTHPFNPDNAPVLAGEVMTDRCSAEVAIPRYYDAGPDTPGAIILKRGEGGGTDWTPPFTVHLSGSGRIRWWCHSTTGNMFDPGTYRIKELYIGTKCDLNADGVENCRPDASIKLGSSAWEGWTPERSRCSNRSTRIRARLGPDRLLQIQCLGH